MSSIDISQKKAALRLLWTTHETRRGVQTEWL